MGIVKSYCRATLSSNLRDDEHHHATEKLAAVALSGKLGNMLFRVKYANDHTSYNALREAWTEIVKSKAVLRKWPKDVSPRKVARLSLEHWHNDVCTDCGGTGYKTVPYVSSYLSDDECPTCKGTAKRPIQVKHNIRDYVADMVEVIEDMTARAASSAMAKLASDMDDATR